MGKLLFIIFPVLLFVGGGFYVYNMSSDVRQLKSELQALKDKNNELNQNLPEFLFSDHLAYMNSQSLEFQLANLQATMSGQPKVDNVYSLYNDFNQKLSRNTGVKIDVKTQQEYISRWAQMLLDKKYDDLETQITEANKVLDDDYKKYLAALPPPPPTAIEGYSYQTVRTEKGTHGVHLIKVPLSSV